MDREKVTIAFIGGDKRTACMIPLLMEKGYEAVCYGTLEPEETGGNENRKYTKPYAPRAGSLREAVEKAHVVVAGIPYRRGDSLTGDAALEDLRPQILKGALRSGQILFAGSLDAGFRSGCEKKGVVCCDFMKEEAIAVYNAVATAEGILAEAIRLKDTNLHGAETLVLGYGRCAKVLCHKLKGLSAQVDVCARSREALASAKAMGLGALPFYSLNNEIHRFEYVFNTVPALLLEEDLLTKTREDVLILDIASGDGGVDFPAARRLGRQAVLCPGLPGKYAPRSSAACLAGYVADYLEGKLAWSGHVQPQIIV